MALLSHRRWAWLILPVLLVGGLALSATAGASSLISSAAVIPPESSSGGVLACPSTTECIAAGVGGEVVKFDPTSPGTPSPTTLANASWEGIACPSSSQCTVVSLQGLEATFNPASPAGTSPVAVDPEDGMHAVSCPSTGQCTAVDENARWVTFDPASPLPATIGSFGPRETQPATVACASLTQCSEAASFINTFNPTQTGAPQIVDLGSLGAPDFLTCPIASQCTGVGSAGAVTFNPTLATGGKPVRSTIRSMAWVSCPTTKQCTGVDGNYAVTFDPDSTQSLLATILPQGQGFTSVSCPSSTQCTGLDIAGREVTFKPQLPGAGSTSAHKLALALKACSKLKRHSKREACIRAAKRRYH